MIELRVSLVLLVIFMITAPMLVKDILELRLPKTASGEDRRNHSLNSGSTMYHVPSRSSTSPRPWRRTSAGRTREWLENP